MLTTTLLLTTIAAATPGAAWGNLPPAPHPAVELWTNRNDDLLRPGDPVRVYVRSTEAGYVTVFRVDTDGRLEVLFPTGPWANNYLRAGARYEIRRHGREAFAADAYPGQGFLFAISSRHPFDYASLVTGNRWDYRVLANEGRIVGDPYVAFTHLLNTIVPPNYDAYDHDVRPYYVEKRYEYPRFLCYDCHTYVHYPVWDPYQDTCVRFGIVVDNAPSYYPSRVRSGTRVVFNLPAAGPRYVFVDRNPVEPPVRYLDRRGAPAPAPAPADTPVNDTGPRRRIERDAAHVPTPSRLRPDSHPGSRRPVAVPDGPRRVATGRRPDSPAIPPRPGAIVERANPSATRPGAQPDRRPVETPERSTAVRRGSMTGEPSPTLHRRAKVTASPPVGLSPTRVQPGTRARGPKRPPDRSAAEQGNPQTPKIRADRHNLAATPLPSQLESERQQ